jgi:serine/threonine-protein kinase HipA
VWLNETLVGTLTNLAYDKNVFVFDEAYVADANRPTLSLSFLDARDEVITAPQEVTARVPPFFSNLLPEGHLREYLAKRGHVNPAREFFLLWLLGMDLPGAVRVHDAEGRSLPPTDATATGTAGTPGESVLRFSLAGVQLKFSAIGQPGKQLTIPVEGRGGHWIVKLPSPRYPMVPENEFAMMKLAAAVGINVAEVELVRTGDIERLPREFRDDQSSAMQLEEARTGAGLRRRQSMPGSSPALREERLSEARPSRSLAVRRFDRTPDGGRIHTEDFNQIYGQFPERKYERYSYGNMAGDIWRVLGEKSLIEFIRRLIFNAAIGNADMHLKNWSVIYRDGRTPELSPAYDFVSTIRYINDPKMALSIAREKDTGRLDTELLKRFAAKARVPAQLVLDSGLQTAERVVDAWRRMNRDLPIDGEVRRRIEGRFKYVPLTRAFLSSGVSAVKAKPKQPTRRGRPKKGTQVFST